MGIAFDKIFPIIKNIKKFKEADQATAVGGAETNSEESQDNLGNNNISQTTEEVRNNYPQIFVFSTNRIT